MQLAPEIIHPPATADAIRRAERKIDLSRQWIMAKECFFATPMLRLQMVRLDNNSTMATDGKTWYWDIKFVDEQCTLPKVQFVSLHELLHVILHHNTRRASRDPVLWNIACDYVINLLITMFGWSKEERDFYTQDKVRRMDRAMFCSIAVRDPAYRMPEDGLLDPKYVGLDADELYDILSKEDAQKKGDDEGDEGQGDEGDDDAQGDEGDDDAKGDEGKGKGKPGTSRKPCDWGGVDDATDENGEELTPEANADLEKEIQEAMSVAKKVAKKRGQMPAGLSELIEELKEPSQDWSDVLHENMADLVQSDPTFAKQDRARLNQPYVYPGNDTTGLGNVAIFQDASGSVSQPEFSQIMSDTWNICDELQPESVTLIQFDSRADAHEVLDRGDEPELIRRRCGGTRFRAPFAYAEKEGLMDDFDVILIFTDGGADDYPEEPDCPVIWCSTGRFWGGDPPFGRVVQVKFN